MTAVLGDPNQDWDVAEGIHPDLRAAVFANNGDTAFIGGDGGVARIDTSTTQDQSASCAHRTYDYNGDATEDPMRPQDVQLCQMLLKAVPNHVTPINDGLRTIQFQSLSADPTDPSARIFGGTQDNGTWSYDTSRLGGQPVVRERGRRRRPVRVRPHRRADPLPQLLRRDARGQLPRRTIPKTWLAIYDPLQLSGEARSFYTPFEVDPTTPGRVFTGMGHVWRTDDNGGDEQALTDNGCLAYALDPFRTEAVRRLAADRRQSDRHGSSAPTARAITWWRSSGPARTTGRSGPATRTGRVFVTSNANDVAGSVSFHRIDTPQTPGRFVTGIAIDPNDPNHAWISYTGYNAYTPDTPGHVFEVNYDPNAHTATFQDRSYNLGDQPITALVEDPGTGSLFAATDFGVLELPTGATQWINAGSGGLPHVATYGLTIAPDHRVLLAATHGRGAYSLELPPASNPPPNETSPTREAEEDQAGQARQEVEDQGQRDGRRRHLEGDAQVRRSQEEERQAELRGQVQRQAPLPQGGQVQGQADRRRRRGQDGEGQAQREGQEGAQERALSPDVQRGLCAPRRSRLGGCGSA